MVEIFGFKLFGCNKTKRRSTRRKRRGYKGGYTYKHTGNNDAGEDVSNVPSASSRKRNKSMNMNNEESDIGMGKSHHTKRRRMH